MYRFGYHLAGATVPTYTAWSSAISGTTNAPVRTNITDLTPGTTFYYFINVYNLTTGSFAPNGLTESFTTNGKVTPITTAATGITSTSATLNGTVNPQGNNVMYRFGYHLAGATVPTYTAWSSTISGTTNAPVRTNITGLTPGTTFYYFINVYNLTTGSFAPNGLTESFTTNGKVTPITTAATGITSTSATLNGTVNPQGNNVMYRFGYHLAGATVPTYTAWSSAISGTTNAPSGPISHREQPSTILSMCII